MGDVEGVVGTMMIAHMKMTATWALNAISVKHAKRYIFIERWKSLHKQYRLILFCFKFYSGNSVISKFRNMEQKCISAAIRV